MLKTSFNIRTEIDTLSPNYWKLVSVIKSNAPTKKQQVLANNVAKGAILLSKPAKRDPNPRKCSIEELNDDQSQPLQDTSTNNENDMVFFDGFEESDTTDDDESSNETENEAQPDVTLHQKWKAHLEFWKKQQAFIQKEETAIKLLYKVR